MPTSYAHYRFGQKVVYELPEEYKYFAYEYPEYFYPGLHGPDLTFYFVVSPRVVDIGSDIHKLSGKEYFVEQGKLILAEMAGERPEKRIAKQSVSEFLWDSVAPDVVDLLRKPLRKGILPQSILMGKPYDAAHGRYGPRTAEKKLAYLYGYLCHFALDRTAHGYVNAMDEAGVASHFEIEAEFDRMLMSMDGYDPILHYVTGHIHPEVELAENIKQFFPGTATMDMFTCLFMQKYLLTLMNLPGRSPRVVYRQATKALGIPKFGDLFMPEHPNPACFETNEKLHEIFNASIPDAVELITGFMDTVKGEREWDEKYAWNFEGEKVL